MLCHATSEQLLALVEICLNLVASRFRLTSRQKRRLMPYVETVRRMSRARSERATASRSSSTTTTSSTSSSSIPRGPPSPPDQHSSSSDDSHPPRPPRPPRPQRTKKSHHHSSLKHGRLNQWQQKGVVTQQQPVVRDLLAEAAAAPLPESDDDDEQMLEGVYLLPTPSQNYGDIPILPDYADEIEEMDTAQQRLSSRRKINGEQGIDKNKKYKIYYSPPPSPKWEQTRRHKRPDHPPPPPPRYTPKVELKRDPKTTKLQKAGSTSPPPIPLHRAKREPKIELAPPPPPRTVSKREAKVELAPPPLPPRHFPKGNQKLEVDPRPSTSKQAGIPKKEPKIDEKPLQLQQQYPPPPLSSTAVVVEEMPHVPPPRRGTKRTMMMMMRVQYSPEPGPSTSAQRDEQQQQRELFAIPSNQLTKTQRVERLYIKCNHYADRMGVRVNTINTANGKPLAHSNLRMAIKYIIDRRAGRPTIKPPGADLLEARLRAKTVAAGFMTDVQVDLADFQALSRHNGGHRYLLVAIDVLSKRLFVVPLKNKRAEEMLEAFKELIEQMPMVPHRIFSDKGTEFKNKLVKEFFEEQEIAKHEPVHSSVKASVAERAIRNVKQRLYRYFAEKQTLNWVDIVQQIVDGINSAPSRVHGMRPIDVNFKNAQKVWKRMYGPQAFVKKTPRFRKDDFVDQVMKAVRPIRYKLRDERGEKFRGTFYEQELARVRKDDETSYRIEKVLKKRRKPDGSTEMLVKFIGYPEREWIDESQLV
ncbi:hypothetical protein niasHT_029398 [Heterodera trifolii]|uniref:Integrase catalytic domain-containing protein n=1 Tax=Heterodera trifolii TaxID=157864 RepID=A0ABD2J9V9_9BILA